MWKIIEDLKSLEIKATHHKEILDEIYDMIKIIKDNLADKDREYFKEALQHVLDKLEEM